MYKETVNAQGILVVCTAIETNETCVLLYLAINYCYLFRFTKT